MMIKYRVREVAKDLEVANKDIIDTLVKYYPEPKKYMTALEEEELNVVFETFTQERNYSDLGVYFAQGDERKKEEKAAAEKAETKSAPKTAAKALPKETPTENKAMKKADAPKQRTQPSSPTASAQPRQDSAERKAQPARQNAKPQVPQQGQAARTQTPQTLQQSSSPAQPKTAGGQQKASPNAPQGAKPANQGGKKPQKQPEKKAAAAPRPKSVSQQPKVQVTGSVTSEPVQKTEKRVVDTRQSNVNIDRYNEKYDKLADQKVKTENIVTKQKFTNRGNQRRNQRRGKRETEFERLNRIAMERKAKHVTIELPEEISVGEFALRLKVTAAEIIKKLMGYGTFASINDTIDFDTASLIADEFHAKVEKEVVVTIEDRIIDDSEDDTDNLVGRAPVVVVMGHVDHGKTSILDVIRNSSVTEGEAGGITQHIGAYRVHVADRDITFLDTPGHAAFTTMRARGAQVTDIAVLVVAADDGIMPQTVEAINHAKAAGVSIIVAINKMDKVGANPDKIKEQLTTYELVPEDWGGDTACIPVSAHTREGIDELLEMISLVADMKELKANPDRAAKGTVVEARLDKGLGPIATVLVQNGTLRTGDVLVAGTTVGRVRVMTDDKGRRVKEAGPSVPVEITGLSDAPVGGDIFNVVTDERLARELVEQRITEQKEEQFNAQTKVTLDNLFDQMAVGEMKELKIIVKADVQGSVEAVRQSLEKLSNEEVRVHVIHGAVGAVSESDVMLANASNAIIVGFNVRPDPIAEDSAKRDGVDMRMYRIIYDCIEEIESAMKGMLAPKFREIEIGKAECREVYKITNVGMVLGSYVTSGKMLRNALVRIVRDGIIVADDKIASLRRFKDDVREVAEGYECGITLEKFSDIKTGDILEVYEMQEYRD